MFYTTCLCAHRLFTVPMCSYTNLTNWMFLVRLKDRSYYAIVIVKLMRWCQRYVIFACQAWFHKDVCFFWWYIYILYIYILYILYIYIIYIYGHPPPPRTYLGEGVYHTCIFRYIYIYKCHVFLPNLRMVIIRTISMWISIWFWTVEFMKHFVQTIRWLQCLCQCCSEWYSQESKDWENRKTNLRNKDSEMYQHYIKWLHFPRMFPLRNDWYFCILYFVT